MTIFGGSNATQFVFVDPSFALLNDVWLLSNADGTGATPTWTNLNPTGTPPSKRGLHTAVYNPTSNRMIVFGGNPNFGSCFGAVNDVWVLTNANGLGGTAAWTQLNPIGGPPSVRDEHTAVYDAANNRMIVFGGVNPCAAPNNDVWVLENADGLAGGIAATPQWTLLNPTGTAPSGRADHSAVYDPTTNRLIVFGGGTSTGFVNDVWVLTNANGLGGTPQWTQLAPTGGPPGVRFIHSATYDPGTNRMTIYGGCCTAATPSGRFDDVWVLENANGLGGTPQWTQLAPTGGPPLARDGHTAVYNSATNRMTVFGGRGTACTTAPCPGSGFSTFNDTWVLTGANGIVIVPLAAFAAEVEITLGPLANDDEFEVEGTFTLGAGSNGINPLTEIVSLQLSGGGATFSTTIPAGSFTQDEEGRFKFQGVISGVALEVVIRPLGGGSFEFEAEGEGADLTGTVNPVTVKLTIGNDGGSTAVMAEFE